jgi:hypothetical protein
VSESESTSMSLKQWRKLALVKSFVLMSAPQYQSGINMAFSHAADVTYGETKCSAVVGMLCLEVA